MNEDESDYTRVCPVCGNTIYYKSKYTCRDANIARSVCHPCRVKESKGRPLSAPIQKRSGVYLGKLVPLDLCLTTKFGGYNTINK